MSKLRDHKKLFVFGKRFAGFAGMLLILLCTFSCSNLMVNDGGSLVIAVPGARAATASSFTIELTGSNGTTQNKTVSGGSTVQFDDLAPDTYHIVVEGINDSGSVVLYGTSDATVTAGATVSARVELGEVVHDFNSLKNAVTVGGTIFIGSDIEFTETINIVVNAVNIMAMNDVTLTSSQKMFQIEKGGKLTLASESKALTLQTTGSVPNISLNGGEFVLEDNVTITGSYNDGCVNFGYDSSVIGTFIMNGGSITGSGNYKGVYIYQAGTFIMNGGTISNFDTGVTLNNKANFTMTGGRISDNSSGASISNDSTFTISGDAVVNSINLTNTAAITVGGVLTGSTPVATITMASYTSRTAPVLKDAEGMNFVSTEYQKFAVGDKSYTIDSSGKLQQVQ
ncbi:MAG: hypothetical protein IKW26_07200 [Treponema sp.]|nr:hypothetical protein [Treponema sp.]